MIRFDQGTQCFNFRAIGIAIHGNRVLLHQSDGDGFWTLPGGRIELGQAAAQTLLREIREELAPEIEVVRLLYKGENFFAYAGKKQHELALYFLRWLPWDIAISDAVGAA